MTIENRIKDKIKALKDENKKLSDMIINNKEIHIELKKSYSIRFNTNLDKIEVLEEVLKG